MANNRNIQELAENILAMLEHNRNYQDIADVVRAFTHNIDAEKKRKREDNLKNWKWNEVIDVDTLPETVAPGNVFPKNEETTEHVVPSNNVTGLALHAHGNVDDDYDNVPFAPFKRNKRDQVKITGRARLCRLFEKDIAGEHASNEEEDLGEQEVFGENASDKDEDSDDGWA